FRLHKFKNLSSTGGWRIEWFAYFRDNRHIAPQVHDLQVVVRSHDLHFGKDGIHFLLCKACCYIVYGFEVFHNCIYISQAFPHQGPCVTHSGFLIGPCMIMQTDMVPSVIPMTAFLWPSYLIRRAFTVKVMAILSS